MKKNLDFTGYERYVINAEGVVMDSMGEVIPQELSANKTCMVVALNDGRTQRKFNVTGLMVQAFEIPMITKSNNKVAMKDYLKANWRITYADNDVRNNKLNNIKVIDESETEVVLSTTSTSSIAIQLKNSNDNKDILTDEEAYGLIHEIVKFKQYDKSFYKAFMSNSAEDITTDIYLILKRRNAFTKYNSVSSKKTTYMQRATINALIDICKKIKDNEISMDGALSSDESSKSTFGDMLASKWNDYEELMNQEIIVEMINSLSDSSTSKYIGKSPLVGTCKPTQRTIAIHLCMGYSINEIAEMFTSMIDGKQMLRTSINKIIGQIRSEFTWFKEAMLSAM